MVPANYIARWVALMLILLFDVHTNTYWNYITFLLGGCQDGWIVTLAEIRWLNGTMEARMIAVEIGAWLLLEG